MSLECLLLFIIFCLNCLRSLLYYVFTTLDVRTMVTSYACVCAICGGIRVLPNTPKRGNKINTSTPVATHRQKPIGQRRLHFSAEQIKGSMLLLSKYKNTQKWRWLRRSHGGCCPQALMPPRASADEQVMEWLMSKLEACTLICTHVFVRVCVRKCFHAW